MCGCMEVCGGFQNFLEGPHQKDNSIYYIMCYMGPPSFMEAHVLF